MTREWMEEMFAKTMFSGGLNLPAEGRWMFYLTYDYSWEYLRIGLNIETWFRHQN